MDEVFKQAFESLFDEYKLQFGNWAAEAMAHPWELVIGNFDIAVGDEIVPYGRTQTLVLSDGSDVVHECCIISYSRAATTTDALRLAKMLRDKERDVESKTPV